MTTSGLIGFRFRETDKLAFNAAASEPEYLGVKILRELHRVEDWELVQERVGSLVAVADCRRLGPNDGMAVTEIRRHFPELHYRGMPVDYFKLFEPLQGSLQPYLEGRLRFMPDASDFVYDSLHCRWAYIANFDSQEFEVWKGKQTTPAHLETSRYEPEHDRMGFYPCALATSYALAELPNEDEFLADLRRERSG